MPNGDLPKRAKQASQGEVPKRLRKWLRWAIVDLKLQGRNQTDIAEDLGVSTATISNKKNDAEGVSIEFALALARLLGRPLEYIASNDPPLTHTITPKVGPSRKQA